mmetsp:Transcript_39874/g.124687  ORF Transcript_39874/g.124687 Transcript_39874/m.124687 type:complete len:321 (+) Transcript_39874:394-1356(+)
MRRRRMRIRRPPMTRAARRKALRACPYSNPEYKKTLASQRSADSCCSHPPGRIGRIATEIEHVWMSGYYVCGSALVLVRISAAPSQRAGSSASLDSVQRCRGSNRKVLFVFVTSAALSKRCPARSPQTDSRSALCTYWPGAALGSLLFLRLHFAAVNRIAAPLHARIIDLPATRREDVFVAIVPDALHDFPRVRLVLLDADVVHHADIFANIKVEERPGLAPRLGHDQVIEAEVVRNHEILLHVDEVLGGRGTQLRELADELLPHILQELADGHALGDADGSPMATAVPIRIRDFELLGLHLLLLCFPFPPQALQRRRRD